MFTFLNCLFGKVPHPKENLTRFTVLEDTDYEGIKSKYCELVKGNDGKFFLKPILGSDCDVTNNIELPSTEGFPASAETEEEYWEMLNNYKGGVLTRDSSKVSNLLNDIALNIPNSKIYVDVKKKIRLCVPDQVILDILRTDEICINDEVIYSIASKAVDTNEILSDEMRAKLLFEKCMDNLEHNFELTKNALKLLTQASMSHLGILINWRFININLLLGIRCLRQASEIELKGSTVSITYNTIWEITSLDGRDVDSHYMKACVKISILKRDLELSSAGNAEMIETCSPFFTSLDDLLSEDLLPSEVVTMPLYLKKIEEYADCSYPIDMDFRDLQASDCKREVLMEFSEMTNISSLLFIMSLDKQVKNYIFSIVNVELPKYIESEARRIFENEKLGCNLVFLDKEFHFSVNPRDYDLEIIVRTCWHILPLGRVVAIAVELNGNLMRSFSNTKDSNKSDSRFHKELDAASKKFTGKSLDTNSNIDGFIVEKVTQYFYLFPENEVRAWTKV